MTNIRIMKEAKKRVDAAEAAEAALERKLEETESAIDAAEAEGDDAKRAFVAASIDGRASDVDTAKVRRAEAVEAVDLAVALRDGLRTRIETAKASTLAARRQLAQHVIGACRELAARRRLAALEALTFAAREWREFQRIAAAADRLAESALLPVEPIPYRDPGPLTETIGEAIERGGVCRDWTPALGLTPITIDDVISRAVALEAKTAVDAALNEEPPPNAA